MAVAVAKRRALYPTIEPYAAEMLPVSRRHRIYVEQCGNPRGKPVIFVHGGPGGGIRPDYRRLFDPKAYRIVLFDQRGCGKSVPHAETRENTTWDLVADMECIRDHLGIDRWMVFGGSWGSTLGLAYAVMHPKRVTELVLRGIFLGRRWEFEWFYRNGTPALFPDAYEKFLAPLTKRERADPVRAFLRRMTSKNEKVRLEACKAWSVWEGSTSSLVQDPAKIATYGTKKFATAFASIEAHYLKNGAFFPSEDWLLKQARRIRAIPGVIVQGRYDVVCPAVSAWELHKAWPKSALHIVPDAGHAFNEPGTMTALLDATDGFRKRR